jgi:hypothetical protein
VKKTKIYSPAQVASGAALGGPIALIYFLRANFRILGKVNEANQTLLWGVLFNVAVLAVFPFVPNKFPNFVIPLVFFLTAHRIATSRQLSNNAIAKSKKFIFESNWKVVGMSLIFGLLFFIIVWATMSGLDALGVIKLA